MTRLYVRPQCRLMSGLADHYGIPSINLGLRIANMARAGDLIRAASRETDGKTVFAHDDVNTSPAAWALCAQVTTQHLAELSRIGSPEPRAVLAAFRKSNLGQAEQVSITSQMLSRTWERMVPATLGARDFTRYLDEIWVTNKPGAKLTFCFVGYRRQPLRSHGTGYRPRSGECGRKARWRKAASGPLGLLLPPKCPEPGRRIARGSPHCDR